MQIQLSEKAAEIVDAYSKRKLKNLNKEIAIGLEQANRGESIEFDFDELMQEVDDELGYTE